MNRRSVLKHSLSALVGLSLAPLAPWAAVAGRPVTTPLTDRLALVSGLGGNVVALSTHEGLVLVDSGGPEHTETLLRELKALPGSTRVRTLFNTHWHLEQTGSNEAFGRSGAKVIAHEKTRLRLATDYYVGAEDRYVKARPKEAQPTETFYTRGAMTAGDERIEYGYLLQAHTDGDIYVFFRDSNVLVVGDAAAPDRDPVLDWFGGGWLGGRIDALMQLIELCDESTQVAPAWGPLITRAELQAEHDVLLTVFERMVELVRKGYTTDDMLKAGIVDGLGRTWADPHKFVYDSHKGIWAHHNTLSHDVV